MTGQVKEEVLTRMGELGVRIAGGQIRFRPTLLRRREFLAQPADWTCVDVAGRRRAIGLPAGALAFTYAQVPVVYTLVDADTTTLSLTGADGAVAVMQGDTLDAAASAAVFGREGAITRIDVAVPRELVVLA